MKTLSSPRKIYSLIKPCRGALKSNLGHLEGGSGIAGLIKTIMVLEKGIIPPNANFERLNPRIDADFSNIKVTPVNFSQFERLITCQQFPINATPWSTDGLRRASVNSFGFGGSNALAVLDDAYHFLRSRGLTANHCTAEKPPQIHSDDNQHVASNGTTPLPSRVGNGISPSETSSNGQGGRLPKTNGIPNGESDNSDFNATPGKILSKILVWSAGDEGGIDRLMHVWQEYFQKPSSPNVAEELYMDKLAYTLASRRSSLPWKSFALIDSATQLAGVRSLVSRPIRSSEEHSVGFIFTGQGAVYNRMGIQLLGYPVFRDILESFDRELTRLGCEWSVFGKTDTDYIPWKANINGYTSKLTILTR